MHASFDQLLRLRDDESAEVAAARHVSSCRHCHAELEQLRGVTRQLRALPDRWTTPDRWSAIREALARPREAVSKPRTRPGWLLPAATAAAVVVAVVLTLDQERRATESENVVAASNPSALSTAPQAIAPPSVTTTSPATRRALIDESQRLEELLDTFPSQPRVTRASTALTAADIEDRIQWVDYRLSNSEEAGLDAQQAQRLWRERVDLLNSLVAVRYVETRTPSF